MQFSFWNRQSDPYTRGRSQARLSDCEAVLLTPYTPQAEPSAYSMPLVPPYAKRKASFCFRGRLSASLGAGCTVIAPLRGFACGDRLRVAMMPCSFLNLRVGMETELALVEAVFFKLAEARIPCVLICIPVFRGARIPEPVDRGTGSLCQRGSGKIPCRFSGKGYSPSPNATAPVLR